MSRSALLGQPRNSFSPKSEHGSNTSKTKIRSRQRRSDSSMQPLYLRMVEGSVSLLVVTSALSLDGHGRMMRCVSCMELKFPSCYEKER